MAGTKGQHQSFWTKEQLLKLYQMAKAGKSQDEIATALDCKKARVSHTLFTFRKEGATFPTGVDLRRKYKMFINEILKENQ